MSKIKGGGRAQLSTEARESIIALLYDLRDHENPLLPAVTTKLESQDDIIIEKKSKKNKVRKLYSELSDHDKKKESRRFLKKLWNYHKRQTLSNKFNQPDTAKAQSTASSTKLVKQSHKPKEAVDGSKKVRIQLVEMIYKDKKKASKKETDKKKAPKHDKKISWKEGAKKIIVIPRNTTIEQLMVQCKDKLRMKKPTRIFMIDTDTNMEIDLVQDLCGLVDGSTLYVTTYTPPVHDQNDDNIDTDQEMLDEQQYMDIDPLEPLKKVYRFSRYHETKSRKLQFTNEKFPHFSPAISALEPLSESRLKLPAAKYRSDILKSLDISRVIVITGATGCGKSTQVPQFILEGLKAIDRGEQANIIVTQPRRVAAMALAKRVAEERNLPPPGKKGSEVGYCVRLDKATSDDTKIMYCTVGILLRMIVDQQGSTPLSSVSTVVIDEVHERDLTTDFALTLLRPILEKNKRISIILMSATASASLFVDFFRNKKLGIDPHVFEIPGRTFPVKTMWLTACEKMLSTRISSSEKTKEIDKSGSVILSPRATSKIDNEFILRLILHICQKEWNTDEGKDNNEYKESGSVLIFLPGKGEIESLMRTLQKNATLGNTSKCCIFQLHSSLSSSVQWRAFQPVKNGIVKIVLSTNVAETSITIPDISIVIDTGRVKEMRFNPQTRIKELITVWTSQASSKQRAGRGGRTGPGICFKLYTEEFARNHMPRQTSPEIMRTPLEELILQICLLEEQNDTRGCDPEHFLKGAPESPPKPNIQLACSHLQEIGALSRVSSEDSTMYRLTPLGYHLSHLPMDPKVGKILVVGCILQCIEPALTVAASLSAPNSIWLSYLPGVENSRQQARLTHEDLIRDGFGGASWESGSVKGDSIAAIAVYNSWSSSAKSSKSDKNKQLRKFATEHALNYNALVDIKGLRRQYKDALQASGLLRIDESDNKYGDDPLLTSCCLVAGLYPNVASLVRPSKELKISRAFLMTKFGEKCYSSSDSFQSARIRNASESKKDAYAVFHSKHLTTGTIENESNGVKKKSNPFLSNINFVSKFAILLFCGDIEVQNNCLIVDEWLKFKVDDIDQPKTEKSVYKGQVNSILASELRKELDFILLRHLVENNDNSQGDILEQECDRVIQVVRQMLHSDRALKK